MVMSQKGKVDSGHSLPKSQGCVPPGASEKYFRGKLGKRLVQQTPEFDLSDPYMNVTHGTYSSLHDPHLKKFFSRPEKKTHLIKKGLITEDDKVLCSRKEFRQYTDYKSLQKKGKKPCTSVKRPVKGVSGKKLEDLGSVLQNQKTTKALEELSEVITDSAIQPTVSQSPLPSPSPFSVKQTSLETLSEVLTNVEDQISVALNRLDMLENMLRQIPKFPTLESSSSEDSSSSSQCTPKSSSSSSLRGTVESDEGHRGTLTQILSDAPCAREEQVKESVTDSPANVLHQHEEDKSQSEIQIPKELDVFTTTLVPCERVGSSQLQVAPFSQPEAVLNVLEDTVSVKAKSLKSSSSNAVEITEPAFIDEHPAEATGSKPKKKNQVGAFFRRTWKVLKKTFSCCSCNKKIYPAD
ncbi:uncharacterized protein [Salminus brasiliensis]|uniref:uncharacterized protein n=1 Tax=Salminus brasiliensis TaxID=930266 RepID=UPI003B82EF73